MKRVVLLLLAAAALVVVGCGGGGGGGGTTQDAVYVDPVNGLDTNAGTVTAPMKTITHALTALGSFTDVKLIAGTYNAASGETFPIIVPGGVTLESNGSASTTTITSPASTTVVFKLANGAVLKNVTVNGGGGTTIGVQQAAAGNNSTVTGCTFLNCVSCVKVTAINSTITLRSNTFTVTNGPTVEVDAGAVDAGTADTGTASGANTFNAGGGGVHLADVRGNGTVMHARGNVFAPAAECGMNVTATVGSGGWDVNPTCNGRIYVDSTNTGTEDGSATHPYTSITHALADANVGSLPIYVKSGYNSAAAGDTFPITLRKANTTILGGGAAPVNVLIQGTGGAVQSPGTTNAIFDIEATGCTVKNLHVVNTYAGGQSAAGIYIYGDNTTLDTVEAQEAGTATPYVNGVEIAHAGITTTITGCTMSAQSAACVYVNADATVNVINSIFTNCANGIVVAGPGTAASVKVRGCQFSGNAGAAIQVLNGTADVGTTVDPGNNTFASGGSNPTDLDDRRTSASGEMNAIDNTFTIDPPQCGLTIIVNSGNGGGWHWRVKGGSGTEGHCN